MQSTWQTAKIPWFLMEVLLIKLKSSALYRDRICLVSRSQSQSSLFFIQAKPGHEKWQFQAEEAFQYLLNNDILRAIAPFYTQDRSRQQLLVRLSSKSSRLHKVTCLRMALRKLVECVTKCYIAQPWASCSCKQTCTSRKGFGRSLLHIHHAPASYFLRRM